MCVGVVVLWSRGDFPWNWVELDFFNVPRYIRTKTPTKTGQISQDKIKRSESGGKEKREREREKINKKKEEFNRKSGPQIRQERSKEVIKLKRDE